MTLILILALLVSQGLATGNAGRKWGAGNLRGLIVGKSKRADMLRRFGKPKWTQTKPEDEDEREERDKDRDRHKESRRVTWNNYDGIGEFPGATNIATDTRSSVVTRIDFFPEKLTKDQAIAHFGVGYIITRYDIDECLSDEEHQSFYESPKGSFLSLEYRARGIAIAIDDHDFVNKIRYVNGPIGSTKSKCK
jgi:hypothetical protein